MNSSYNCLANTAEYKSLLIQLTSRMIQLSDIWSWPNWPLTLFIQDLQKYPPTSEEKLYEALLHSTDDYLLFFRESRDYERPPGYYVYLWQEIRTNPVLLHFDTEISYLLSLPAEKHIPEDDDLANLIQVLAQESKEKWMEVIRLLNNIKE